jgi:hypothetical protein
VMVATSALSSAIMVEAIWLPSISSMKSEQGRGVISDAGSQP